MLGSLGGWGFPSYFKPAVIYYPWYLPSPCKKSIYNTCSLLYDLILVKTNHLFFAPVIMNAMLHISRS